MCVTFLCLCCNVYVQDVVLVRPPSQYSCPTFINKVPKNGRPLVTLVYTKLLLLRVWASQWSRELCRVASRHAVMLPLQLNRPFFFFFLINLVVLTSSFLTGLATSENISHTTELHSRSVCNFYSNIFFQFLQSADKPRTMARNSPWQADIVFSYPRCCNKVKLCISVIERNGFM